MSVPIICTFFLFDELIDECMNVLNQCEYARFAPASDTTAQMLYDMSFRFITAIENEIKKM